MFKRVELTEFVTGKRFSKTSSCTGIACTLLLLLVASIAGCGGEKKDPQVTEELQGTWKIVAPADFPFSQITFSDSRVWMTVRALETKRLGPIRSDYSVVLDPATSPKSISITPIYEPINRDEKINRQEMLGIYSLDSKRLKIRLMAPGAARPNEFLKESKDAPGQQCECVPLAIAAEDARILDELQKLDPQYFVNDAGHVTELNLSRTGVRDAYIDSISELPELTTLYLWDTAISDNAIQYIARMKKLTHLYLTETKVSDAAVNELASIQGLKLINLSGSKLTKAGADKLADLLGSRCELQWKETDAPPAKPAGQ